MRLRINAVRGAPLRVLHSLDIDASSVNLWIACQKDEQVWVRGESYSFWVINHGNAGKERRSFDQCVFGSLENCTFSNMRLSHTCLNLPRDTLMSWVIFSTYRELNRCSTCGQYKDTTRPITRPCDFCDVCGLDMPWTRNGTDPAL